MRGARRGDGRRRLPRRAAPPARPRHDDRRHADHRLGRLVGRGRGGLRPTLAERAGAVVVAGLSMGGSLTLWPALHHPEVAGLVCVNPATRPQPRRPGHARRDCSPPAPTSCPASAATSPTRRATRSPTTARRSRAAAVLPRRRPGADVGPLRRADACRCCCSRRAQDHVVEPSQQRVPRRALRRPGRPPLARAQLPRGDAGLRPRRHRPRGRRVRPRSPGPDGAGAGQHPQPVVGHAGDRPAVAQRLRPDDRPRRRRRRVAVRPAAGGRASAPARTPTPSPCGACIAGVIGARLYHVLTDWERFEGNSATSSRSGRAASASPAGCSPASSSARTSATGGASRSAPASTPWRRRCRSPRRSVGGATTSTRSSTGGPTDLPWALEIDAEHLPTTASTRRARRSTRRSSTSRCGTSPCAG